MSEHPPIPETIEAHPAWFRLHDQHQWYSKKSARYKKWYLLIKLVQIVLSGAIPVVALVGLNHHQYLVAAMGAGVAAMEGILHLFQCHALWIEYRSAGEQLKAEKYFFLSLGGPYRGLSIEEGLILLSERVEGLLSREHTNWTTTSKKAAADLNKEIKGLQAGAAGNK